MKFDNTSIEKPKIIVIEVFNMATPTVLWHFSSVKNLEGLLKKFENDEMHAEYKSRKVDSKEIERLLKERKINYNHFMDSKDINRQFSDFSLKRVDLNQLPKFLQENSEKYSEWFD